MPSNGGMRRHFVQLSGESKPMTTRSIGNQSGYLRRIVARNSGVLLLMMTLGAAVQAASPISISDSGTPSYSQAIVVPPGIAGLAPNIGFLYSAGSVNGPVGYGWSVQGISMITRCPGSKLLDGYARPVDYTSNDKLCLDGQRLIQTDSNGVVVNGSVTNPGVTNPFQQNDVLGGSGMVREYRTEKDTYARIRAYGYANGDANNGPAYFKVWTKGGQIYEYGVNSNTTANAQITAQGKNVVVAWPVSRISDTVGNYIDFQYDQHDVTWGSANGSGVVAPGREWNITEIRYTGNGNQQPVNKVVFEYVQRADNAGGPQDRSETYHQGSKNVSVQLLSKVRTYINWPANQATQPTGALNVKTYRLTYDSGSVTHRSRLTKIVECNGNETQCLPAMSFNYAGGGTAAYASNANFRSSTLATLPMQAQAGNYGLLLGDFNGDGRTDFIRWSDTPSQNMLYLSNGDGTFTQAANFNLTAGNLFKSDGCYQSYVADFNGDGLPDILRVMQATSISNASCGTVQNILYLNSGNGGFAATTITGIDFSQVVGNMTPITNCTGRSGYCVVTSINGFSQTAGANFHLADVNNDGLMDIVTTIIPAYTANYPPSSINDPYPYRPTDDATLCSSKICTHVYMAKRNGTGVTFEERTTTNLAHRSVYARPQNRSLGLWPHPYVLDVNGDGGADFVVDSGTWISRGNGDFDLAPNNAVSNIACGQAIDVNGDGRSDCIYPSDNRYSQWLAISRGTYVGTTDNGKAANFNLTNAGQELGGATTGMSVADFDGDGRGDILRWNDDPYKNAVYLSNGDGTFRPAADFSLVGVQLQKSDGTAVYYLGDFTGRGTTEILRVVSSPVANTNTINQLYVKGDSTPADQLQSVTTATGLTTTLTWVPLPNSTSGSLGARYTSDRGTGANAASYPVVDLTVPTYVVATTQTDSGVGSSRVSTEYAYAGLKTAFDGRGWLGFRETRKQSPAPDGSNLTVWTQLLQNGPQTGLASVTETRLGPLNATSPQVLSRSTYVYCDKTAATGAETSATSAVPCPTSAQVKRPYVYQSEERSWDLNGVLLPVVTTTNTVNNDGDPSKIVVQTVGTAVGGLSQTVTRTTTNLYQPDATAGDSWTLGRLSQATVQSSVPNDLGRIATSAGSAPNASSVGTIVTPPAQTPPVNTSMLMTIIMQLLDDDTN